MNLAVWVKRFDQLGVELRDPDDYGNCQCYFNGIVVAACSEDDSEAIREVVATGVPWQVVVTVSKFYNEMERGV